MNKLWSLIIAVSVIVIICSGIIFLVSFQVHQNQEDKILKELNIVNGICTNIDSEFCGCNMTSKFCPSIEKGLCNLAKCFKNNTLYYLPACPHCQKQLELLFPIENNFNKIDCNSQKELCIVKEIVSVPAWEIDEKFYVGTKAPEELWKLGGCSNKL